MDNFITVRDLLSRLYKDAEYKGILDEPVGTISTGMSDDGGSIVGIVIWKNKQHGEIRAEAYYRKY